VARGLSPLRVGPNDSLDSDQPDASAWQLTDGVKALK
jgi:hypothetical protein